MYIRHEAEGEEEAFSFKRLDLGVTGGRLCSVTASSLSHSKSYSEGSVFISTGKGAISRILVLGELFERSDQVYDLHDEDEEYDSELQDEQIEMIEDVDVQYDDPEERRP